MTDQIQDPMLAILQASARVSRFPTTSRYYSQETAVMEDDDGREIIYLRRRFIPQPERFTVIQEHFVAQGERLDLIAAQYLGDPEQFWRICDANGAMLPADLEEIGRKLRITLAEGIQGVNYG